MRAFWTLWLACIRRDRLQLTFWIIGNALMALVAVGGVAQSFGTSSERAGLIATVMANRVIMLFRGLPSGLSQPDVTIFLILPFLVMIAGFMSSFLAVRHTRTQEEDGRAELVAATTAGRIVPLAATIAHGLAANVLTGVLIGLAFSVAGLPAGGSFVAGAAVAGAGTVFLAVSLVGAQLFPTARGANTFGVLVIMITFLLGGIGNALGTPSTDLTRIESSWLTWTSPFGWAENTRPYDADALGPVALSFAVALVLVALTAVLQRVRDVGGAFVPARRGPAHASTLLRGGTTLVWHLTRSAVIVWVIGGLVTGLLATALASVVSSIGSDNPGIAHILTALSGGDDLTLGTVVMFFTLLGVLAACCAVQIMTRARQEEAHGTVEPVWTGTTTRTAFLGGYLARGLVGVVATILAGVVGAFLGLTKNDADVVRAIWVVAGGQVVASCVFLGIAAVLFVVLPRWSVALSWVLVLVGTVLGFFGPLFGLPAWTSKISPIAVAPTMTASGVDLQGLLWLVVAVVVTVGTAFALIRRRELVPAS